MTTNPSTNPVPDDHEDDEPELLPCAWCHNHEHPDDCTTVETRTGSTTLCDSCYDNAVTCEGCGNSEHYDDCTTMRDEMYCERCARYFQWCDECEEYYEDECSSCHDSGCHSRLIHDYSYRPQPQFHINRMYVTGLDPRKTSVTGFELEMEAVDCSVNEGAQLADSVFGEYTYMKYDGSLNNGFELVSHPMSREFSVEVFPWERLRELANAGMRSAQTRTCGLHIHINRSHFADNPTTLYRFMSMFYRNAEQWKAVAGRSNSSYANWSEYELDQMLRYTKGLKNGNHSHNSDRYVALNLQNANTIELRFFKGTLRPESFIARIEAVHAVAEYAHATRNNVAIKSAHDWDRFREWTTRNGYTHFNNYAELKGV